MTDIDWKKVAEEALYHLRCVSGSRNSFTADANSRLWDAHNRLKSLRTPEVEEMHQKAVEFLKCYDHLAKEVEIKKFTFYWLNGKKEVLKGESQIDALNKVGYGQGAIKALDFCSEGECDQYVWKFDETMKKDRWINKQYLESKYILDPTPLED